MAGLTGHIISDAEELAKIVGKVAPLLGAALGSPIFGLVTGAIANKIGAQSNDPNTLVNLLTTTPAAMESLQQMESENSAALAQITSIDYATEVRDRMDARVQSATYQGFIKGFAYVVTGGFFAALILFFFPIPMPENSTAREMLSMLVGMLASKWQTIIDFFYGSSHPENKVDK